jgi:hypothetical protein
MSDSEVEFESADEGSKSGDGWEIETDFDLPDLEQSIESKPTEIKSSALSSVSDLANIDQYIEHKHKNTKSSNQTNTFDAIPTLQSRLDKLTIDSDDTNSKSHTLKEDITADNALKETNCQSSVSKNVLNSSHFTLIYQNCKIVYNLYILQYKFDKQYFIYL